MVGKMRGLEQLQLSRLCSRVEVDPQEIDSSIGYFENKKHILDVAHVIDREGLSEAELDRFSAWVESRGGKRLYDVGKICPICEGKGSGLHLRWVLNDRKQRFYPYYYFAHSLRKEGRKWVKWCYVRKAEATALIYDAY